MKTLDTIEQLVDRECLADVLADLSEICSIKAEHIAHSWQDNHLAGEWHRAGQAIDGLLETIKSMGIPQHRS